ncbi:hypothetical protein [Mesorhizobium xinjiangense]|uniref:hypothetical protein n=1 Tax=Mesorhizobium xinjiangense TaxID=2678685 RepID=UPI0012ED2741|nr:hypothetical protein [Mesorhizobium xinjiangense]
MSVDPETLRQIEALSLDTRPLLVLDVDDVVLEFIRPFPRFLAANGYELRLESFRLNGNVRDRATGKPAPREQVGELLGAFFDAQAEWQTLTDGVADTIAGFADDAEIVMLTAMPHRHRAIRRAHLDRLGLHCPLVTTEMAKGPAIRRLRGQSDRPVAFVDDLPHNLVSARDSVFDAHLFHLMADNSVRALLPQPPDDVVMLDNWRKARLPIAAALGL